MHAKNSKMSASVLIYSGIAAVFIIVVIFILFRTTGHDEVLRDFVCEYVESDSPIATCSAPPPRAPNSSHYDLDMKFSVDNTGYAGTHDFDLGEMSCGTGKRKRKKFSISDLFIASAYAGEPQIDVRNLKLIKTGTLQFKTSDHEKKRVEIETIIETNNAFIAMERETKNKMRTLITMSIKTPSGNFEKLMNQLTTTADTLEEKKVDTENVTEKYVDFVARLKAKRRIEEEYLVTLKKAKKVEDILKVQERLGDIRSQIESLQGKIIVLNNQTIYSTIYLTFSQEYEQEKPEPKKKPTFLDNLKAGFSQGWNAILGILVVLAYLWPFIIIIGIISFFVSKKIKKEETLKLGAEKPEN